MKRLILFLLFVLPIVTQAQKVTDLLDKMAKTEALMVENQSNMVKILNRVTDDVARIDKIININAHYDVDKFRELEKRIAELEKIVNRLKQKEQQDSIKYASEAWIREKERQGICVEIEPEKYK